MSSAVEATLPAPKVTSTQAAGASGTPHANDRRRVGGLIALRVQRAGPRR